MSHWVSTSLKSLLLAAALALPALAADTKVTPPLTLDASSEVVVGVVNPGSANITYQVAFYDTITGTLLQTKQGTLAGLRGAAVTLDQPGARDAVVAIITTSGNRNQLSSFTVRDRTTKVPRYTGAPVDGQGI